MQRVSHVIWAVSIVLWPCWQGCGSRTESTAPAPANGEAQTSVGDAGPPPSTSPMAGAMPAIVAPKELFPEVLIATSVGDIKLRLNAEKSRMTVENFLEGYVDRDFYAGTVFHHVEKGFMIIGGGYAADGAAKATRTPIHNEAHNGLKNRRGTIAMARDAAYADSATSQFFINLADNPSLDYAESAGKTEPGYCVFGEVVAGMDVVDRIAQVPVKKSGVFPMMPAEPVTIRSVKKL